jgi:hypothetical protein
MQFMNDYDLDYARARFTRAATPNRLALVMVVDHLREWADNHSDGWAYWPKPCRAADKAMTLINSRTSRENDEQERTDITEAEMLAAVRPIKAFLTKHKELVSDREREIILRAVTS